ncbi:MAG: phosphoserine phosphatase SerB [Acidobacteriota bacterium]
MLIVTIVAPEPSRTALAAALDAIRRAVTVTAEPRTLCADEAYELEFADSRPSDVLDRLRTAVAPVGDFDLAVRPADARPKRLLVADMESTIIENEMLDELATLVGAGNRVAEITARAMNGELDFREALQERVGLLEGLPLADVEASRAKIRLDPGARVLVSTLRAEGFKTALVSGGFMRFAEPVAEELGFGHCQANRLEDRDGHLTGRVLEPVLDRDAKVAALDRFCGEYDLGRPDAVTIGDGANDLSMLQSSGLGVAYRGKPAVAAAAPQRLDHGDLSVLLYFLGIPKRRWIGADGETESAAARGLGSDRNS